METHARSTDPDTSHLAVPDNIAPQALRVLRAYRNGNMLLDHDAYDLAGYRTGRLAHQRCSDLRRWKMIARTGERGETPSGNTGHLCVITDLGLAFLAKVGPAA